MENKEKQEHIITMEKILNNRKEYLSDESYFYYGQGVIHTLWMCDIITDEERAELKDKFELRK